MKKTLEILIEHSGLGTNLVYIKKAKRPKYKSGYKKLNKIGK